MGIFFDLTVVVHCICIKDSEVIPTDITGELTDEEWMTGNQTIVSVMMASCLFPSGSLVTTILPAAQDIFGRRILQHATTCSPHGSDRRR